jgi:asparagine synthase (glutamine-hydrolysing)
MSLIAGLISKRDEDVTSELLRMLKGSRGVMGDAYGIATPDGVETFDDSPEFASNPSSIALGYKFNKVMPTDQPQPIQQTDMSLAINGRIWGSDDPTELVFADLVEKDPERGLRSLIEGYDGSCAAVVLKGDDFIAGRDRVGVVPLYCGESDRLVGIASNRKMLWMLGLQPIRVEPGHIVELSTTGFRVNKVKGMECPCSVAMSLDEAVGLLDRRLAESASRMSRGLVNSSLGFSGGIDSTLLAYYLNRGGTKPSLVCVGVEGSADFGAADEAAESLGLPIAIEIHGADEIREDLDEVLLSVEEADPMKVGVALPLLWVAEKASGAGSRVVFSGTGSDELFGGYARYVEEYVSTGDSVRETMLRDLISASEVNYERDFKVCADLGVELRLPYTDGDLISLGLSMPTSLKLPKKTDQPRKIVLRALAERLGLPREVANRPKKAIQYSTGVAKALEKLSKAEGLSVPGYLRVRFEKLRNSL